MGSGYVYVRERFNENLLRIGTSAAMSSETNQGNRNMVIDEVAKQLFEAR
ncbi:MULTISPECIES: hypothetical protein [Aminobacterium]|jgi:hypothetical protein|nr:hypothetical protein [Aminobacterium sp. UBA4908]